MKEKPNKSVLFMIFSLGNGGTQRMMVNVVNKCEIGDLNKVLYLYNYSKKDSYEHLLTSKIKKYTTKQTLKPHRHLIRLYTFLKIIRKENIITIVSFSSQATLYAVIAKKIFFLKKIKVITRLGALFNDQYNDSGSVIKRFFWRKVTLNFSYMFSDKIICLTDVMKNDLIHNSKLLEKNIVLINNYVDIENIRKMYKNNSVSFSNYFITVGRIEKQKNIIGLIKAFSLVKNKIKEDLIILGNGSQETEIIELIKKLNCENRVRLLGFKSNPYKFIHSANFFVLNSIYEGMSNVLLEALACSTPVIVTNHRGSEEVIQDKYNGLVIPMNDNKYLSEAILLLSKNHELRMQLAINGYNSLKSCTNSINKYSQIIKETSQ